MSVAVAVEMNVVYEMTYEGVDRKRQKTTFPAGFSSKLPTTASCLHMARN